MPPPNAYIVLGHGDEDIVSERKVVPDGCMLVVSEECGVLGTLPDFILEVAQRVDYEQWFRDPFTYKKELESVFRKPLHIYRPGETYPTVSYTLFDKNANGIYVSGVWPLPLPPSIVVSPGSAYPYHVKGADAWKAYSGSVYPRIPKETTQDTLERMMKKEAFETSQWELFEKYPGVYFNFLCRDIASLRRVKSVAGIPKGSVMNIIRTAGNLLETPHASEVIPNQPRRDKIKELINAINNRRSKSRNRTERRREESYRNWFRLFNALESSIAYTTSYLLELLSKVPQTQINFQESRTFYSLLHIATIRNKLELVDELLRRGANPNIYDDRGQGPLLFAASQDPPVIMKKLLLAGAHPSAKSSDKQQSPLFFASTIEALELLVSYGANINETDIYGNTVLNTFILTINDPNVPTIVKKMIELGADITIANKEGYTPFLSAIRTNDIPTLDILFDMFDTRLFTINQEALTVALNSNKEQATVWLVSKGFPVPSFITLARIAREKGFKELVSAIVGDTTNNTNNTNRNRTNRNRTNGQQTRKKQRKSFK